MKILISKFISVVLVLSVIVTLFGNLSASAATNTVTQYYLNEKGGQIKETSGYVVSNISGQTIEGYDFLSYTGKVTYTYCKTIAAYVEGYTDGSFKPNKGITRAEASKMLYQFIGTVSGSVLLPSDVIYGQWYYEAVAAMFNAGYLSGYPDGTFLPDKIMTRAEFVKLILGVGGITGNASGYYSDVPVTHWAYNYINLATSAGLISGYGNGRFGPDDPITRAEVVTIINRLYKYSASEKAMDSVENSYTDVSQTFWGYEAIMIASGAIGQNIKGTVTDKYVDTSNKEIAPTKSASASKLSAPEIDGFTCIYIDTVNNYSYEKAAEEPEPSVPSPSEPEPSAPSPSEPEPSAPSPSEPEPSESPVTPITINDIYATETEWDLLMRTNKIRLVAGVKPLTTFSLLQEVASIRTEEAVLVQGSQSVHIRPDGSYFSTILSEYGILYNATGENSVQGSPDTIDRVILSWIESSGHYANMIGLSFTHMGAGISEEFLDHNNLITNNYLQLFIGNCVVSKMYVAEGYEAITVSKGTGIDDMGIIIGITCPAHGDSYMPLVEEMCSGYNANTIGKQTVTVTYANYTATIDITVTG